MKIVLLTLMIMASNGQVHVAHREHKTAEACASEGLAFIAQDPNEFGEGARIAFVCEPKTKGDPA